MPVMGKSLSLAAIEGSPEIQSWLGQFPSGRRLAAISLLMHLRFIPRDTYSNWLLRALRRFSEEGVCAVYSVRKLVADQGPFWNETGDVVARPGSSLGSEDLVYSVIANASRSTTNLLDHPSLAVLRESRVRNILLVDDSIGSGKRVSDFIGAIMSHRTFVSWWSFGFVHVHILSLARTHESEKAILDAIPGSNHGLRVHPKSSKVSFVSRMVYSRERLQDRWGGRHQAVLDLCDSQRAIPRPWRRGFRDAMANIIFYHSVPNNTPGVIWYTNSAWAPLFHGRALPEWLVAALDGSVVVGGSAPASRVRQLSPEMIGLLHLVKRGVRREASLALRMGADGSIIAAFIKAARDSGFVTSTNRITAPGVGVLKRAGEERLLPDVDRSLYVPESWCAGR